MNGISYHVYKDIENYVSNTDNEPVCVPYDASIAEHLLPVPSMFFETAV